MTASQLAEVEAARESGRTTAELKAMEAAIVIPCAVRTSMVDALAGRVGLVQCRSIMHACYAAELISFGVLSVICVCCAAFVRLPGSTLPQLDAATLASDGRPAVTTAFWCVIDCLVDNGYALYWRPHADQTREQPALDDFARTAWPQDDVGTSRDRLLAMFAL